MSTAKLARFVLTTRYEDLPGEAVRIAKGCILDTLGVAVAGAAEPPTHILLEYVKEMGGLPAARVWGHAFETSPPYAALLNGTSARALDFDDTCYGWRGHPSALLVPVLLVMADVVPMSGQDAIAGFMVAHEIGLRAHRVGGYAAYDHGADMSLVNGCFAGAAIAGRALGLDEARMRRAFGIASCGSFGLMLSHGTHATPYQEGYGAMNGLQAALLAKHGLTAHEAIFETHPYGRAHALTGDAPDVAALVEGLGSYWAATDMQDETGLLCPKLYPACGATHTSIEAMLGLAKEHDIDAADVESVVTETRKFVDELLLHRHRPTTGFEGKFSMEYSMAAALLDRQISLSTYTDEMVARPRAQELLTRVTYAHEPDEAPGDVSLKQTVTIKLRDGTRFSRTVDFAKGHPQNPMSWDELVEKFRGCAEPHLGRARADRIVDLVMRLETVKDMRELGDALDLRKK
jgi:2-methylcitrate dehydratase PrpD